MNIVLPVVESALAVGAIALVWRFVGRLFRRPSEEPDDGDYAEVTAPLRPRSPRRTATAAVEEPDQSDDQ